MFSGGMTLALDLIFPAMMLGAQAKGAAKQPLRRKAAKNSASPNLDGLAAACRKCAPLGHAMHSIPR